MLIMCGHVQCIANNTMSFSDKISKVYADCLEKKYMS